MNSQHDDIRNEVAKHNIDKALSLLEAVIAPEYKDEFITIKSRYSIWLRKKIIGTNSGVEEINEIVHSLLVLIDLNESNGVISKNGDDKICTLVIHRPYQIDFASISFDIRLNDKIVETLKVDSKAVIRLPYGKYKLKIDYLVVDHRHAQGSPYDVEYRGESDEVEINLDSEFKEIRCGFGNIVRVLFGLLRANQGHKIYIEYLNS